MSSPVINYKDIKLYLMTQDVNGQRTYREYVDSMAQTVLRMMEGYRLDPTTMKQLVDYAEQNWESLK